MIEPAYLNPTAYGDLTGINRWVWIMSHLFADSKFMSLFSMLFGAGIILFTTRIEKKGIKPAKYYYSRSFWLLILGLLHAYFIWYGDILVIYAVCSLFLFLMRKVSAKKQLITGIIFIAVPSLLYFFFAWSMSFWPPEGMETALAAWKPGTDLVHEEVLNYQGGWKEQLEHRVPAAIFLQTAFFLMHHGWRAAGLMLIGMALFQWRVLTAERSYRFYFRTLLIGLTAGYFLTGIGVYQNFRNEWSIDYSMYLGVQFNYWGSVLVAMGYIGMIMIIVKKIRTGWFVNSLARVGQAAFTNYLSQSILCTLIFYGHGFGLYGTVERKIQILIVFCIWTFQLLISSFWFKYFRYGPAEWFWRSVTYLRLQPFRKSPIQ